MAPELQALEDVARMIAPEGAEVHHLCASGHGTFSVMTTEEAYPGVGTYALKVVEAQDARKRTRELAKLRQIVHPHLVRYRDSGTMRFGGSEFMWIAMDFVEGSTLAQVLADGVNFDLPTAVRLLQELVSGATALWDIGTAHGNLAEDNVIVTGSGKAVIVDLGIAQHSPSDELLTSATPEQGIEYHPYEDWRADQFALGLLGYRMTTGVYAFAQLNDHRAATTRIQPTPRPASDVNPTVPAQLSRTLSKMLAADLQDRFAEPATLQVEIHKAADAVGRPEADWLAPTAPGPVCRRDR